MFTVKINDKLKKYCWDLVNKYNFWQRWIADWDKKQQWVGCIGENAIRSMLNKPWLDWKSGFDWWHDINFNWLKIDVKTMWRKTDVKLNYVNNLIWLQKNYDVDIYIFCSYNFKKSELTICWWITKEEFFKKASFYKKGQKRYRFDWTYFITKADLYEIKNSKLNQVKDQIDLLTQMIAMSSVKNKKEKWKKI